MQIAALTDTPERPAGIRDTSQTDVAIERQPRRARWVVAGIAGAVMLVATAAAWPLFSRWAQAELTVPVERLRVGTVTRGDFVRDVGVQGTIVAAISPTLFAPVAGTITLEAEAGDTVSAGDVVAVLDSPDLENELAQERATLESLATEFETIATLPR